MDENPLPSELEAALTQEEREPISFWEKKQRELVTAVVDYNLSTLTELVNNGDINLQPSYQRRNRWDDPRKSRLIESFLMNVPVPPIFLNEDEYGQYSVIDGRQRLMAISEFLNDKLSLSGLEIFSEINDKTFRELPPRLQTVIRTRPILRSVIILRQSDADVKYEVFRRLNTGGVKLNAQEVRNSVYTGPLNDAIAKASEDKLFQRMLGIANPRQSRLYQEMGDVELALRFFAFRNTWRDFKGGIVKQLDKYMDENKNMAPEAIEEAVNDFHKTVQTVHLCFGETAFRRWRLDAGKWRKPMLASLYDTQMLAFREYTDVNLKPSREQIVEEFKGLFNNAEFQKAIDATIPPYFALRVELLKRIIERALGNE